MSPAAKKSPILVLDTASPTSSVAVGTARRCLAARAFELRQTSERLLDAIREVLAEAKVHVSELGGVAALQGPGSFTGLRIGLATAMGFHQALGLPATALPTLPVLALAARDLAMGNPSGQVIAAVDALRGEYLAQTFEVGATLRGLGQPRLMTAAELLAAGLPVIGFGISALSTEEADARRLLEPPPLAAIALRLLRGAAWDPGRLVQPIYFRAPAVTLPLAKLPPAKPTDRPAEAVSP